MLSLGTALAAGRSDFAGAFRGQRLSRERIGQILDWNRKQGVDTVAGLNEAVRSGRSQGGDHRVAGGL